jgi:hypothetical protein
VVCPCANEPTVIRTKREKIAKHLDRANEEPSFLKRNMNFPRGNNETGCPNTAPIYY